MKLHKLPAYLLLFFFPITFSAQQLIVDSITHDDIHREYILYVPEIYTGDEAVALVLNYHGYTASALIQVAFGDFRPIADTTGFLVVHPQGTVDNFGNTHWNIGVGNSDVDDVGFTAALIDSLSAEYNIDPKKIYATGMSNGGFMSYKLACELNDRIAAIASVTGSMRNELMGNCSPAPPIPVMEVHGTEDETVPYEGGFLNESIPDIMAFWADVNNCSPDPTITEVPDLDPNDGSTVEHHVWADGDEGVNVELFKVIGGGHTWPGTALGGGTTNYDIDASAEIWKFFSRYDIDGLILYPGINDITDPSRKIEVYPNPATNHVWIALESFQPSGYLLMSMDGREVKRGSIKHTQTKVDLSGLNKGTYFLHANGQVQKIIKVD